MNYSIEDIMERVEELLDSSELCSEQSKKAKHLAQKLSENEITVSVIGQFKRGKSTLVNAILGQELLPVGIIPVTSVVTEIRYGEKSAEVHFDNGVIQPVEIEELPAYINEQENQNNKLGVSSVKLQVASEFLEGGLTFVDTPGVGSVHKHNSDAAYAFVKESDAVIFMISVDSPINEIEINFLKNAKEFAAKFYFTVNKIDYVNKEELEAYLDYCRKLLCSLMEVEEVMLLPVSAKNGTGVEELKEKIRKDCNTSIREILEASTIMKLKDIINGALSRLELYWNALKMPVGKLEVRFEKMKTCLKEIEDESRETALGLDITDSDKYFEVSNLLEIKLNEMKKKLTEQVAELFGMEYHYELTELNVGEKYRFDNSKDDIEELKDRFIRETELICKELDNTLNLILLYREKNTITVSRRVEDLNKLTRHLKSLKSLL